MANYSLDKNPDKNRKAHAQNLEKISKIEKSPDVFSDDYVIPLDVNSSSFSSSFYSSSQTPPESKSVKNPRMKKEELPIPFTAPWIVRRIQQGKPSDLVPTLQAWVHSKRRREISEDLISQLTSLPADELLQAVRDLLEPRQYIRGTKGYQLDLPVVLTTLDGVTQVRAKALIDSGCTGSCIDEEFARKQNLPRYRLPLPIPVYNADGTHNEAGSITECVKVRMTVRDHEEAIELAVTKLGGSDVFIGHDWLKLHNPHIDWQEGTVVFDRCPDICGYTLRANRVDQDLEGNLEPQERLEEGDRLFFFDWEHYV